MPTAVESQRVECRSVLALEEPTLAFGVDSSAAAGVRAWRDRVTGGLLLGAGTALATSTT